MDQGESTLDTVFFGGKKRCPGSRNDVDTERGEGSRPNRSSALSNGTYRRVYVFYTCRREGDFVDIVFRDAYNDNQKRTSISANKFISGRKHLPQKEVSL